ncbi:ureidoglycolate dehydrogenase [Staphylococcus pseudintermedius]|uniref:ureidoglycolate dehydrogenase n=1 Tax=Staphylococcus pseudintermedius TaxID=283734 RepID=UPI00103614FC|nr:ureidoglycolate dehydrogenase [Staphylococcus pseudintermedius]EGQ0309654.1 ureidoglycolate dehydrogenase [Staphylococcus pseudintermedius]EGQ0315812.1 ureidoglycolate dehydrogenase [Staphylococcus pseudintermedius]EGQ0362099.1 ureidoglycolate dehydrogenase [Staphylococcus pseudintermedius]EGQ0397582.1 ureidoglycolate dehydrogenase [Staphylococcus pseudintermedius]EGQ1282186.1 ureidoglycolate dehydrogenase [Staphylococcus pseudintermedius]
MENENLTYIEGRQLRQLMKEKLVAAGLPVAQAEKSADLLIFADERGIHSHGAVRMRYYAERIVKKGYNLEPQMKFEQTGPSTGVFHGDNALGHFVAYEAMQHAIDLAKESGLGAVGIYEMGHSGAIGYYAKQAAEAGMVALTMCQSDPMVVPYGGTKPYYGTNPIAFASPRLDETPILFDMATTVQAWGKILDAQSKGRTIPDTWAVDDKGHPTTDPNQVSALLPMAGAKGYGLMMMVDILAGSLLGLPHGMHVTSMYKDLSEYRRLGQFHLVINPSFFGEQDVFLNKVEQMVKELHQIQPANGFDNVYYPGEIQETVAKTYAQSGIPIPTDIVQYLESPTLY